MVTLILVAILNFKASTIFFGEYNSTTEMYFSIGTQSVTTEDQQQSDANKDTPKKKEAVSETNQIYFTLPHARWMR